MLLWAVFLIVTLLAVLGAAGVDRIIGHRLKNPVKTRVRQMTDDAMPSNGSHLDTDTDRNSRLYGKLQYFLLSAGLSVSARLFVWVPLTAGGVLAVCIAILTRSPGLALGVPAVVLALPAGYVLILKRRLEKELIQEMPEAIGMVIRSLQVGLSVDAALKEAAAVLTGPLGMEIRIIYQEMAMGMSFEQAFHKFDHRYSSLPDVKIFCSAFILQRETGGNLVRILESLGRTIRNRFQFQRQIKTYTAEARLSALIIALLPLLFGLAAMFLNPDYLARLTGTPLGRILIYTAIFLEIVGFVVMRRMARMKI